MADFVEKAMQEMVPELDDLRRKRIFKDPEIRQIVQRRREFEYKTQQRNRTPQDFLNYIRYEVALECLRKRRSKAMKWGFSLSDHTGIRRVISIFDRCVLRFRADKRLWYQYADFCLRSGSTKHLSGVLRRAVKFHPREVQFWLLAADRELKFGHVQSARTLLLRSLRCVPRSAKLWSEFFRLETQIARRLLEVRARISAGAAAPEAGAAAPEAGAAAPEAGAAAPEAGAAAPNAPTESAWAPAGLLLRRGLRRMAASPGSCAALLAVAADCVGRAKAAPGPQEGLDALAEELRAVLAEHRPGTPGREQWTDVEPQTASKLWELWWGGERAASRDWPAIVEDVATLAPPAVVGHCAAVLAKAAGPAHDDISAQKALFTLAAAHNAASDADMALVVLEALEDCSQSQPSPESATASRTLLQNAAKLHPSCPRLALLARKQLATGDRAEGPSGILDLARKTCNLEPSHAAQLLLLALCSDGQAPKQGLDSPMAAGDGAAVPEMLETLLRLLVPEASPRPLVDALLLHALGQGAPAFRAAVGAVASCAARLWDAPRLRAQVLAAGLDAELRACGSSTGTVEEAQQLSRRFEEVLTALAGAGRQDPTEWWLRYREFAERAERRGLGAGVPTFMDLHWRAMRSVKDQARYSEQAHKRLQASSA